MIRVRPSLKEDMLRLVQAYPGVTRSEVAGMLDISYGKARHWLDMLMKEGKLKRLTSWIIRPYIRRLAYYSIVPIPPPPKVYYRTQFAVMFYAEKPRSKTPDPIAEFRVVVVSDEPGRFDIEAFDRVCIYIGVILAPQTYWIVQLSEVTAYERDEEIDVDELELSVPTYKRLNYAERYACFFRSRRGSEMWRDVHPEWWKDEKAPVPAPREGDYEYSEDFIKATENRLIGLKVLKYRFNNETGEMESVTI